MRYSKQTIYRTLPRLSVMTASLLFLISCSRTIERPTKPEFKAPTTPAGVTVGIGDRKIILSWESAAESVKYRLYRVGNSVDELRLYDSTTGTTYTDRNVSNGVTYYYQVASVNADGLEGVRSPEISGQAGVFSIALENDKQYTKSRTVSLSLTAPSTVSAVRLAASSNLSDRPWLPYSSTRSWEVSSGDGEKTVYAEFRDVSGATSVDIVSDDIILDTRAVIDSVTVSDLTGPLSAGDTVVLSVAAGEAEGEASVQVADFSIDCYDDGTHGDRTGDDGIYVRNWEVPFDADFESQAAVGRFTDRAGNTAENRSSQGLLTVRRAPDPVTVFAFTESEARIGVSWTQSEADDFEYYRLFRGTTSGVNDHSTMVFSTGSRTATTYADTGLTAGTSYYYSVWVYDQTGLTAAAPVVSARTDENTAPEAVIVSEPTDVGTSQLRITWTASTEDDFASYRLYRSPGTKLISIISTRTQTQYTDDNLDLENESYQYWVEVWDRSGVFTKSNTVSWAASGTGLQAVTVTTPQPVDPDSASVRISWTPSDATNFQSYRVYRSSTNQRSSAILIGIISTRTETQYVDGNGDFTSETYYYWVAVFDTEGVSVDSSPVVWDPNP